MGHKTNRKYAISRYLHFRAPNNRPYQILEPSKYKLRMRSRIRCTIRYLEREGIIEPYDGPILYEEFRSFAVPKMDGETRFCRDYRPN